MLLIIEDKDDPTGQIAEETQGGQEFVYIPVIRAPTESDMRQTKIKCALDRMRYDSRKNEPDERPSPQRAEKLIPLYLRALGRTGKRPAYLSDPAGTAVFGAEPESGAVKLCARG